MKLRVEIIPDEAEQPYGVQVTIERDLSPDYGDAAEMGIGAVRVALFAAWGYDKPEDWANGQGE